MAQRLAGSGQEGEISDGLVSTGALEKTAVVSSRMN